ncbi:hypothetical protein D3C73_924460 [compost metagenome]
MADGQAQPGAAEPPGDGGVGLAEPLEQLRRMVGAEADAGVAHLQRQQGGVVAPVQQVDMG